MSQFIDGDTIVALATPPGRGAVALVRLSGAEAHTIARRHIKPWPSTPRVATLTTIRNDQGAVLDRALVTLFLGPHSFTGEDTVEVTTHGGVVAPTLVSAAFIRSGARQAFGGEFTRRAVLNGKLDFVQAEAIGDLIDARSRAMHGAALHQLDGGLSARIIALRSQIIHVEALVAYDIDFPEEDDGPVPRERIAAAVDEVCRALTSLLETAPAGELIREGAVVVIAGPPNAGKSSLFNALLGAERAIVTDIPGTTRDAIEAVIDTATWPIRLVDTAGLRDTTDTVERIGIEVSTQYLHRADVVLACGDSDISVQTTAASIAALTSAMVLGVRTKVDLQYEGSSEDIGRGAPSLPGPFEMLAVSAITGRGIRALLAAVDGAISARHGPLTLDAPVLTRERHRRAVTEALDEVTAFRQAWAADHLPAPVAAVHLRAAVHALEEVVGAIDVEDIFDRLFQTFCVGK